MKIPSFHKWAAVGVSILAMTAVLKSSAEQAATAPKTGETYTGTVAAVDPQERVLDVKGALASKKFILSDTCTYMIAGKDTGSLGDLRPGQRVTVSYHINRVLPADRAQQGPETEAGGRRIMVNNYYYTNDTFMADHVQQELMTCQSTIRTNDLTHHTLVLRFPVLNRTFQIPDDCRIILHDGNSGTIADIQRGNYVTVTYETPGNEDIAREIVQTNTMFIGKVTALNPTNQTITAATFFLLNSKEFRLTSNCVIVANGKTGGQLSDLKICDKLAFTYDNINGVDYVSFITNPPPVISTESKLSQTQARQTQALSPRRRGMQ